MLSAKEYVAALEHLQDELHENDFKMLNLHYSADERTITASEMAIAMNYAGYGAANLRYGTLAGKVCRQLNSHPECKVEVIADMIEPNAQDNPHWLWIMRPEVAQALEELGWV